MLDKLVKRIMSSFTAVIMAVNIALPLMPLDVSAEGTQTVQLYKQSFELYPDKSDNQKTVSLEGMMPKGATAEAVDVTSTHDGIAAYDITIKDGNNEYQPGKKHPILVEINDNNIKCSDTVSLWHIKDNGERERVDAFMLTDSKVSFYATGFSVYEIVDDVELFNPVVENASSIADLYEGRAGDGFLLYYGSKNYFTSSLNINSALTESTAITQAAVWYFEKTTDDDNTFKIYTKVNNQKKYIQTKSGNNIELGDNGDTFSISDAFTDCFYFKKLNENKWLQHSNSGGGIRYYTDNNTAANSRIKACFADKAVIPDDYYNLSGKTYGIVTYLGGSVANAFMANEGANNSKVQQLVTRDKDDSSKTKVLYVTQDSDITLWEFTNISKDIYKLSADVNGTTKYLKLNGSSITLVDSQNDASDIKVDVNKDGTVTLSSGGKYISFDSSNGFVLSDTAFSLNLARTADISSSDNITYSADRISVSDGEQAYDGREVIVYTRIWDDTNKKYDFYAIDHDGSLKSCYASGDKIMWIDDTTNSLLWKLTVYTDNSGKETGYYELQNTYSGKYIAPQLKKGTVLSDEKIGIQLPDRKYEVTETDGDKVYNYGEYYSPIVAWDKSYYDYAALSGVVTDASSKTGKLSIVPYSEAASFYFAVLEDVNYNEITGTLHEVETVDNNDYGITLKMIDFDSKDGKNNVDSSVITRDYFNNDSANTKNLLKSYLDDNGDPIVSSNGKNFGNAFANASLANHLFIKSVHESSGYFEYDSCQNFATLVGGKDSNGNYDGSEVTYTDEDGNTFNNFTVFKELGTTNENKTTTKHGQFFPYNYIKPGAFSTNNPQNLYSVFARLTNNSLGLLSDDDPRKYENLYLVQPTQDCFLGMEMEAKFVQTPSGLDAWGHDVIFEFTGDDDFWLFVDGELVIDLGGIHSAEDGKVNFRTGQVYYDRTNEQINTTLRDIFISHYKERGMSNEAAIAEADKIFVLNKEGNYVFKNYSEHSMKIYYMERGAGASNLHMRFNLSSVTPGNVLFAKTLSAHDGHDDDLSDIDYSIIQYPFQIMWSVDNESWNYLTNIKSGTTPSVSYQNSTQTVRYEATFTPPNYPSDLPPYESVFFISPNRNIEIDFPDDAMYYRIVECAVNTDNYDLVTVNGDEAEAKAISGSIKDLLSNASMVKEMPSINFDNRVSEGNIRTLSVTKKLYDENGKGQANELKYNNPTNKTKEDRTTFNFRLYLSNGTSDELKLANICRYYVTDPNGMLCKWDPENEVFISTTTPATAVTSLSNDEKNSVTFHTSSYGAISNIPAGYSFIVPGLPAGTKFKVEERDYEIPLGYDLIDFERVESTYLSDDPSLGTGEIRAGYDARMLVNNRRGFGLEATKLWSNSDFTSSHDTVYSALYLDGQLVEGTVKKITDDSYTVRYFFNELPEGKTLADYEIHEVELTDPVEDENGIITGYSSLTDIVALSKTTDVEVVSNKGVTSTETYTPKYTKGETKKTVDVLAADNSRSDYITNIRKGGITIDLNKWNNSDKADEPLKGGTFVLTCDNKAVGTYVTGENGNVTTLYGFETDKEYVITQTVSPKGYRGIAEPIKFKITDNDGVYSISVYNNPNDTDSDTDTTDGKYWSEYKNNPGDGIAAKIDLYNKPYTFKAIKVDSDTNEPLDGAVFELHRSYVAYGSRIKDRDPMSGYSNLISGDNVEKGVIPKINETINSGTYYLTEVTPPDGYDSVIDDIMITLTSLGTVSVESRYESYLSFEQGEDADSFVLNIPNTIVETNAQLTIQKKVDGVFSNKYKEFTFTLRVKDAPLTDKYEWSKNGIKQSNDLSTGSTFTMKHSDLVIIDLPAGVDITISEANENYTTTFKLNDSAAVEQNSATFSLEGDSQLDVTNTLNGVLPTGIALTGTATLVFASAIVAGWLMYRKAKTQKELEQ